MKLPKFANNKAELARLAGTSRPHLYRVMRIPGFPRPRSDGRWCVSEVQRFIQKSAKEIEGPNVRDRLQTELLTLKIQRASQELAHFEEKLRDDVSKEIGAHFVRAINIFATRLKTMPRDLAARCEGLSAQQIFKVATEMLYAGLDQARRDFLANVPEKAEQQSKMVPFKTGVVMEAEVAHA